MKTIEVKDRQTFRTFVEILREQFSEDNQNWENATLDSFLVALGRYTDDIQGYYDNTNQNVNADIPSWKVFADILTGAAIYE